MTDLSSHQGGTAAVGRVVAARKHGGTGGWHLAALATGVMIAAGGSAAAVIAWHEQSQKPIPSQTSHAQGQALFLARSTLLALQHANVTQDYRVLWQLSAPAFQSSNPPQRLSDIFAEFRQRRLDLSVAALSEPQWLEAPKTGADGHLALKGYFRIGGRRLHFDLVFVPIDGLWKLSGISVFVREEPMHAALARDG